MDRAEAKSMVVEELIVWKLISLWIGEKPRTSASPTPRLFPTF